MHLKQVQALVKFCRENGVTDIKLGDFEAKILPKIEKVLPQMPKKTAEELLKEAQEQLDDDLYRSAGRG